MAQTKDQIVLSSAGSIIQWDMETKMPPRAIEQRSQQLALISRIKHKLSTSPEIGKLLKEIMASPKYDTLNQIEKRNIFLIKKDHDEQTRLPEKLVSEIAKQQSITVIIWKKAKAAKNFNLLKPELEKLIGLKKQAAEILMQVKQTSTPYDALVDDYEPKMTSATISGIFTKLRQGLTLLMEKIQNSNTQPNKRILKKSIPIENQREIAQAIAQKLGYDIKSPEAGGRIDETEHPFTSGYYDDVRITTHYYPNNYASSIFSVLHEVGHALYEQNLNPNWKYQPVGSTCSYGLHESQSRFFENIVGRSREFWTNFFPQLKQTAPFALANVEIEKFIHGINAVKTSKIRVEADEVTYNMHIIIRYQIEKEIFAGKIKTTELPDIWNQKYAEYLGVKIKNDSEGVMQDTHWASGYYGYFPSYALGNIYSGQIAEALTNEVQDWRSQIAKGELESIKTWLIRKVYSQGDLYDPADLLKKISGKKMDVKPYLDYLQKKYGQLYSF